MSNIYVDKLNEAITVLGGEPVTEPAGNVYVAKLDEVIASLEALTYQAAIPAPPATEDYYLLTQVNPGDTGVTWRTLDDIAGSLQPYDPDLTAIASLTGSTGLLEKTATNTWKLDTTTYAPKANIFNNDGNPHIQNTDFNALPATYAAHYVAMGTGSTPIANGPPVPGATSFYGFTMGVGTPFTPSQFASQIYWPRSSKGGNPYLSVRFREDNAYWTEWQRIYAGYADSAGNAATTSQTTFGRLNVGSASGATEGQIRVPGMAGSPSILIAQNTGSPIIELKDGASPAHRWWLGQDTSGKNDGIFYVYDAQQAKMALTIDTSQNTFLTGGLNVGTASGAGAGELRMSAFAELSEMTAPAAGEANSGRLYLEDNGAGKTRLMIKFSTGAAQQIAIQP